MLEKLKTHKKHLVVIALLVGLLVGLILTQSNDFVKADDEISSISYVEPVTKIEQSVPRAVERHLEFKELVAEKAQVEVKVKESDPTPEPILEPVEEQTSELVAEEIEPVVEEIIFVEEVIEEPIDSCFDENVEYGSYYEDVYDVPEPTTDPGMAYLGDYRVTFYSAEAMGNSGSASGFGSIPWATCAAGYDIPFGSVVYIEGFGSFTVEDRGVPSGCIDIFVTSDSEIPSWGMAYIPTYIVSWGTGRTAWGYE